MYSVGVQVTTMDRLKRPTSDSGSQLLLRTAQKYPNIQNTAYTESVMNSFTFANIGGVAGVDYEC